jgi:hypothetical protein
MLFAACGVILGLCHLYLALQALFVFREHEPLTSWIVIGTLFVTLPASMVAFWKARAAAVLLGIAALTGLVAISRSSTAEETAASLVVAAGPQALLGGILWIAGSNRAQLKDEPAAEQPDAADGASRRRHG